jgi:hypothetical protein
MAAKTIAGSSPSKGGGKTLKFSEDEISIATNDHEDEDEEKGSAQRRKKEEGEGDSGPKRESMMLQRPLPELPLKK